MPACAAEVVGEAGAEGGEEVGAELGVSAAAEPWEGGEDDFEGCLEEVVPVVGLEVGAAGGQPALAVLAQAVQEGVGVLQTGAVAVESLLADLQTHGAAPGKTARGVKSRQGPGRLFLAEGLGILPAERRGFRTGKEVGPWGSWF